MLAGASSRGNLNRAVRTILAMGPKTVIVKLDGRLAMAVVPATHEVDMSRLRTASGATFVELADTSEFIDHLEGCQLGTMPPFGNLFGMETYLEQDMAKQEHIAFNAGTHTEAIIIPFAEYRRLAHPMLAHIATTNIAVATR